MSRRPREGGGHSVGCPAGVSSLTNLPNCSEELLWVGDCGSRLLVSLESEGLEQGFGSASRTTAGHGSCQSVSVWVGPWCPGTSPPPAGLWLSERDPAGLLLVGGVSALLDRRQSADGVEGCFPPLTPPASPDSHMTVTAPIVTWRRPAGQESHPTQDVWCPRTEP